MSSTAVSLHRMLHTFLILEPKGQYTAKYSAYARALSSFVGPSRDAGDRRHQLRGFDWFRDMREKAGAQRARSILGAGERSQRNRRQPPPARLPQRAHPAQQLEAVDIRHSDVADHHVRLLRFDDAQRLPCGGGNKNGRLAVRENSPNQFTDVGVVINNQNPEPGEIERPERRGDGVCRTGLHRRILVLLRRRQHDRKPDRERRALGFAGARRLHRAAVQLDQMTDDSKSQAEAAVAARRRCIGLPETFEHMRQELRLDAGAGVGDADLDVRSRAVQRDPDPAAFRGELDRVGHQVTDHLL